MYKIVYCFVDKFGAIERDEFDQEIIYIDYVSADSKVQARKKFLQDEGFVEKPEILQIKKENGYGI